MPRVAETELFLYKPPKIKDGKCQPVVYKFPGRVLSVIAGLADLYLGTLQGQALLTACPVRVVSVHFGSVLSPHAWRCAVL